MPRDTADLPPAPDRDPAALCAEAEAKQAAYAARRRLVHAATMARYAAQAAAADAAGQGGGGEA